MTALWHLLMHAGIHLANHLNHKSPESPPAGCRKCQRADGTMYATNCCGAALCESCAAPYNRAGLTTCSLCNGSVVRR